MDRMIKRNNRYTRCPKSLLNGPCGGVHDNGLCELSTPENPLPCIWIEILNRLKEQGRANEFLKIRIKR